MVELDPRYQRAESGRPAETPEKGHQPGVVRGDEGGAEGQGEVDWAVGGEYLYWVSIRGVILSGKWLSSGSGGDVVMGRSTSGSMKYPVLYGVRREYMALSVMRNVDK